MLLQKLYNNEINEQIINDTIYHSLATYDKYIRLANSLPFEKINELMDFISDDIYEFDCVSKFSQSMIFLGINTQVWRNIHNIVETYNNLINNKVPLYQLLQLVSKSEKITQNDRNFLNKILNSYERKGSKINNSNLQKLNEKISLVEKKLIHDYNNDSPSISLPKEISQEIPMDLIQRFYDSDKQQFDIKLDKYTYIQCHKYITKSEIRKKLDDTLYQKYQSDIPKLLYLFTYRYVKANMLGYKTYIDYVTTHNKDNIKTVLTDTIEHLKHRSDLELNMLSKLKFENEGDSTLYTWDIAHYINKWRTIYGVNDVEVSEYFEFNNTLKNVLNEISSMYEITFASSNKYRKWSPDILMFKIMKGTTIIGELTLDLFARDSKMAGTHTTCINTQCFYPHNKQIGQPANIIMSDFIIRPTNGVILLTINDLHRLFIEFGKVIYFISRNSTYSIFGSMYTNIEYIDAFGKFLDLCLFDTKILQKLSSHYKTKNQLTFQLADKINKQLKLDNGISYKYQCMYGLYDLFVHSDSNFISECRELMNCTNEKERIEKTIQLMCVSYDMFYNMVFEDTIKKDIKHFNPITWSYLFNGNENINFLKVLSDMYAYELLRQYKKQESGRRYCQSLQRFIASIGDNDVIEIDKFLSYRPSISTMFNGIGLNENDSILSLYNIDAQQLPIKNKIETLCTSPNNVPKLMQNYFEEVSENDPEIRKLLGEVMR